MVENKAVENALGTIGAVLWTIQIIPQLIKSYRTKDTEGLSALLMLYVLLSRQNLSRLPQADLLLRPIAYGQ
jgi:uncharacterized protein with PQ loop repeat